jgi:patatin-like phospholipase/acyl hydrolase
VSFRSVYFLYNLKKYISFKNIYLFLYTIYRIVLIIGIKMHLTRIISSLKIFYPHEVNYTSSIVNNTLKEHRSEATISLTTCATSAAPTYFPEMKWNNLVFWDGGLLNNNPVNQLWAARYDLVESHDPEPKVSCVLSLGCGYVKAGSPSGS